MKVAELSTVRTLLIAWGVLCLLTLLSLLLGRMFHLADWLPLWVAAIVWIKGWLVCRYFLESGTAHPFIRRLLAAFIAFAPLALLLTGLFGTQVARWTGLLLG